MMRLSDSLPEVLVCCDSVDFRKGINGLSLLVEQALGQNPFSERLFVFTNRRQDKVKILYWERNGFCLWQKRLEEDRFHWPVATEHGVVTLSGQQLNWLLDGFDLRQWQPHVSLDWYKIYRPINNFDHSGGVHLVVFPAWSMPPWTSRTKSLILRR